MEGVIWAMWCHMVVWVVAAPRDTVLGGASGLGFVCLGLFRIRCC